MLIQIVFILDVVSLVSVFVALDVQAEDVVDGIIYVFDYDGGTYGGADYFPCDIELAPAQEGEAAPSKNVTSVVESLKAAKTYFNLPIAKQMSLKK